ncbi:phage tail protein [Trinickia mobilis]|uniref:phage tail protein n=1 Tax=Trinickia mobilis TaxID=2816356 RepID=UPI001A8F2E21|nr:phage tail protein [Trinickia mobilis]
MAAATAIRVQTSQYARPIPIVYGTNRVTGNIIWYGNFQAIPHNQASGGKGGGGGSGSTSYTYTAAVAIGLCHGTTTGIGKVWSSNSITNTLALGLTQFAGTQPQTPWGYLTTNFPSQALSYANIAYVVHPNFDLGSSPSLPNLSFEVIGKLTAVVGDVSPEQVLYDYLSNSIYGAGMKTAWFGDWTQYNNYCFAMGLLFSPVYDSQSQAMQNVKDLLDATNSAIFWSEGLLKIVPYGDQTVTGDGTTFTPNVTPVYALNDDNFIFNAGQDPVQIARSSPADAYNLVDVEWYDRLNSYNISIAEAKDQLYIQQYGPRPDSTRSYHFITTQAAAQAVAQFILQRNVYIRNTYTFTLGWVFCALEPMDIVTITDTRMGLTNQPVRITQIVENENGDLTFTAEEFPLGVATPALYTAQGAAGYQQNYNVSAPNVTDATIFEPPARLTGNALEVWAAVCGGPNWGGCDVWVSTDNSTFQRVGTINGGARMGVLSSSLGAVADPDTTSTLAVDLTESTGVLSSGTQAAADTFQTLCLVDGELISYETATLTGTSKYNLTYLRRGVYGTTLSSHNANGKFARLDQSVFQYTYAQSLIGSPLYLKFVSFNQYGSGQQSLATVPTFTYNLTGTALNAPLPNVTGLNTNFVAGIMQIFWTPVTDFRQVDYEVRMGATWASGHMVTRTPLTNIPTQGDGTYWVAAHYRTPLGIDIYSPVPVEIVLAGTVLVQNVVASVDEMATNLQGTFSGGAAAVNDQIILQGAGNILTEANVLTVTDIIYYGGLSMSGGYALPPAHTVNVGRSASCSVRMSFTAYGQSIYDNMLTQPDVLTMTDVLGAALGQFVTITPQIATAPASGVFGAWQNYQPGTYNGQYFKAQLLISTSNPQVTPLVTALTFAVDVPDRVDTFTNVALPAAGTTITYATPFNGGPSGASTPNTQVTILNAQQGDTVVVTPGGLTSVTVQVLNGGVGVARNANVFSQGY